MDFIYDVRSYICLVVAAFIAVGALRFPSDKDTRLKKLAAVAGAMVFLAFTLLDCGSMCYTYVVLNQLHELDPGSLSTIRVGERTLSDPAAVQAFATALQGTVFNRSRRNYYAAPLQVCLVFRDGRQQTLWVGWTLHNLRVCTPTLGSYWPEYEVGAVPGLLDLLTRYKIPGPTL